MVKTKAKYECEECGKELKNARALAGHLWFAHGKRGGEKHSLYDKVKLLEREKGINPDTVDKIDKIAETSKKIDEVLEKFSKLDDFLKKISDEKFIKKVCSKGNPDEEKEVIEEEEDEISWGSLGLFGLLLWVLVKAFGR